VQAAATTLDQEQARQRLVEFAKEADYFHVQASRHDFDSFGDWANFVLNDTAYGAALIQSYWIPAEITHHLESLWNDAD